MSTTKVRTDSAGLRWSRLDGKKVQKLRELEGLSREDVAQVLRRVLSQDGRVAWFTAEDVRRIEEEGDAGTVAATEKLALAQVLAVRPEAILLRAPTARVVVLPRPQWNPLAFRQARELAGLTVEGLAAVLQVVPATIENWEREGYTNFPQSNLLMGACEVLGADFMGFWKRGR